MVRNTFLSVNNKIKGKENTYQVYGFDIMLDDF